MAWYDFFSNFYDASLEPLYRDARLEAVRALELSPGQTVLDLPCGTGASFAPMISALAGSGRLVGVDASAGMLRRAKERYGDEPLVQLMQSTAETLTLDRLGAAKGVDRLHIFLGLSTFPAWESTFDRLFDLLAPGGRCVVVDVHSAKPSFQGHMVNLVARAEIQRRTWEPLEKRAQGFTRVELPSKPQVGGQLFLASGVKG